MHIGLWISAAWEGVGEDTLRSQKQVLKLLPVTVNQSGQFLISYFTGRTAGVS